MVKKQTRARAIIGAWPFPIPPSPKLPGEVQRVTVEEVTAGAAEPERIRVDEVQLHTDPSKNTIERIAIAQLLESPFNPRTRFDGLQEMAETMKSVGVMQPILVRPITLEGFEISKGDEPQQVYEIIYGHRRMRAAKLAELQAMPCIVRKLTDAQSAQLQAIENVQRKDLDAIDEAQGYQHYIDVHGVTKDQLAAEVGLSRTHVYSRLKLLNAVPVVQEALRKGEIGSEVALLIARIHTPQLQEKALAAIKSQYYDMEDGGKKSFRQIRDLLSEKFTLDLKSAIFDTKAEDLIELAGSCTSCSKRTENAPEFFNLVDTGTDEERGYYRYGGKRGANLCTDPDCYEAKKKQHLANKAAELAAKGKTVVTGGKARAAISAEGVVKGAYIALKDVKAELAKKGKKPGADVQTVTIQNPRDGKTVEAVAIADLQAAGLMKAKAAGESSSALRRNYEAEEKKREARAAVLTKINYAVLAAVRTAAAGQPLTPFALQLVVRATFGGLEWEDRGVLAKLHGFKNEDDLEKKIGQLPADRLATLLLDCALVKHVESNGYEDDYDKPDALRAAAKHYGVDVKAITREIEKTAPDTKTKDLPLESGAEEEDEAADGGRGGRDA